MMSSRNSSRKQGFRRILYSRIARFIAVGLVNTGSTYLLYLFLLLFMNYQVSYAISYMAGIVLAFTLNSKLVFKVKLNFICFAVYPLIYGFQYVVNAWLIVFFVSRLGIVEQAAPLLAIILTLPIMYLLNKLLLSGTVRKPTSSV